MDYTVTLEPLNRSLATEGLSRDYFSVFASGHFAGARRINLIVNTFIVNLRSVNTLLAYATDNIAPLFSSR